MIIKRKFDGIYNIVKIVEFDNESEKPIGEMTPEEIREYFATQNTEQGLADAFAITSNEFFWVADNIYDYEEGTPEHKTACEITYGWGALMDEYKERIFAILTSNGVTIPASAQIRVLMPFMARNGYKDANGWWIKDSQSWLRHSSVEMTGDIYTHITEARKARMAEQLNSTFDLESE